MDSVHRTSTFPVVCLLLVHYVAVIYGGGYCDSPYNNGRPINIPEEEYARYCCKADDYGSPFTSTTRFDCASEGGCCGEVDKQYCCARDRVALQLGLGIAAGVIVLLVIITCIVCYCFKSRGYTCNDCCKGRDKPIDLTWNNGTSNTFALENTCYAHRSTRQSDNRTTQTSASISFHREPHTEPISSIMMLDSAPPPYVPDVPPDAPPPSYIEVIRNPHVFARTDTNNAV